MMFIVEKIGKSFLELKEVTDFKEEFWRLYSLKLDNLLYLDFFNSSFTDRNQFESFLLIGYYLNKSSKEVSPIFNKLINYCSSLTLKINFILWILNNYEDDGKLVQLINLPNYNIFEEEYPTNILDNNKLKETFEVFFPKNENLFELVLNLKNLFHNSNIVNKYFELSNSENEDTQYYKQAISSYFYIIKEIIFEIILYDNLFEIDDDNILKYSESNSAEGNLIDMKIINSSLKEHRIIKITHNNIEKFALISSLNLKITPKKCPILRIKGEYVNKGFFGKYSKNAVYCSKKLNELME